MRIRTIASFFLLSIFAAEYSFAQYSGPSPYLSFADSPLAGTTFADYFYLEDFEDGLNSPGLAANAGFVNDPGVQIDSVDADDGLIDGSGNNGHSYYSDDSHVLRFTFDSAALGGLPTHAGLAWTDVGLVTGENFGFSPVIFEAFDAGGTSLGAHGPFILGDGFITGETAEDRVFAIVHAGGISAIEARMPESTDWEVDHVQYGRVPEPSAFALLAMLALLIPTRYRA
ncbi:MAG: hypothetical protein JNG88_09510 [Phycisphaerales bacterium]|nr:hypothetical protein [Phycisphaerales bacterium]